MSAGAGEDHVHPPPALSNSERHYWRRCPSERGEEVEEDVSVTGAQSSVDTILLYYLYTPLACPADVCKEQVEWGTMLGLNGRIRVSTEGLNGTLDGNSSSVAEYMRLVNAKFAHLDESIDWKLSIYPAHCSRRFKGLSVKECKEVISTDLDEATREKVLEAGPGPHLTPEDFHLQLQHPAENLVLLDVRNFYETRIGRFEFEKRPDGDNNDGTVTTAAIDPFTRSFSDLFRHFALDTNCEPLKVSSVPRSA